MGTDSSLLHRFAFATLFSDRPQGRLYHAARALRHLHSSETALYSLRSFVLDIFAIR